MAQVTWKTAVSGSWQTAGDWSTGTLPGTADNALLTLPGTYVVTSTAFEEVNSVLLSLHATLDISAGGFELDGGTGTGANAGSILVANGNALTLGGSAHTPITMNNSGTIALQGSGSSTSIHLNATTVTLTGGGTLTMTDSLSNVIESNDGAAYSLINAANTIAGAGTLYSMGLVNQAGGIIEGTGATNALLIDLGNTVVGSNAGLIESTSAGGLIIDGGTTIDNIGGIIKATGAGSKVELNNADVVGGTLSTGGVGVIETFGGNGTLDGTASPVMNTGSFAVTNGTSLYLYGTISNSGTISVASTANATEVIVSSPTVTLTGGGQVVMSGNANNYLYGANAGFELVNVNNTISGGGTIGANGFSLVNQAAGVVDANSTTLLVIQTSNLVLNAGLLEGTGGGSLELLDTSVNNAAGKIIANGGTVDLNSSTVMGGLLEAESGGVLQTFVGTNALDGISFGTVTLSGLLTVSNNTVLLLDGTISDAGSTIGLSSTVNTTQVEINGTAVLQGGGALTLSNSDSNYIQSYNSFTGTLINVDNTISGTGHLGNANMTLVNEAKGVIDATNAEIVNAGSTVVSTGILTLNANGGVTNAGLIEDTGTAGLAITNTVVDQSSTGIIEAKGAKTHVDLNSATIVGGKLETLTGGLIQAVSGNSTLDGITAGAMTLSGSITVTNGNILTLTGTFKDSTATKLSLASTGSSTYIEIAGTASLTGGGSLILSNSDANDIFGSSSFLNTLINVDNTISGTGNIGDGRMTLVNQAHGVIDANNAEVKNAGGTVLSSGILYVDVNGPVTNAGVMEDTGTAGLAIYGSTVNQSGGGVIKAVGAGSHVDLYTATIIAGTLTTSGGGVIQSFSGTSALDGQTDGQIINSGTFVIDNATAINVLGTLDNTGTINESGTGNTTEFRLDSQVVTLTGGGVIDMTDFSSNYILAAYSQWQVLDNVNNTIAGSGNIGDGAMQLQNSGTIDATGTSAALTISLGSSQSGVNNAGGVWEATGTAGLVIASGIITDNGLVDAAAGSSVTYNNGVTNTNMTNGTLTGGTWEAGASATISLTGGTLTTDAATIILSGAGSAFRAGSGGSYSTIESTLTTIAAGGTLELQAGRSYSTSLGLTDNGAFTLAGTGATLTAPSITVNAGGLLSIKGNGAALDVTTISDSGTLTLGGPAATVSATSFTVNAGGLLSGNATIATSVLDAGTITASGGLLDVTKNLTGAGTATIATGSTLEVDGKMGVATVTFAAGSGETLALKTPATTTSQISGWAKGTTIDLINTGVTKLSYSGNTTSGTLTVLAGTTTVAKLSFLGDYTTASFSFTSDGNNGNDIVGTGNLAADLTSVAGFDLARWHAAAAGGSGSDPGLGGGGTTAPYVPALDIAPLAHH
jgi:hypothetical protein